MDFELRYRPHPTLDSIEKLARIEEFLNVSPGKFVPHSVAELAREISQKLRGQNEIDPKNFLKLAVEIIEGAAANKDQYVMRTPALVSLTHFQQNTLLFAMLPQVAKAAFCPEFKDGVNDAIDEAIKEGELWASVSDEEVKGLSGDEESLP